MKSIQARYYIMDYGVAVELSLSLSHKSKKHLSVITTRRTKLCIVNWRLKASPACLTSHLTDWPAGSVLPRKYKIVF